MQLVYNVKEYALEHLNKLIKIVENDLEVLKPYVEERRKEWNKAIEPVEQKNKSFWQIWFCKDDEWDILMHNLHSSEMYYSIVSHQEKIEKKLKSLQKQYDEVLHSNANQWIFDMKEG